MGLLPISGRDQFDTLYNDFFHKGMLHYDERQRKNFSLRQLEPCTIEIVGLWDTVSFNNWSGKKIVLHDNYLPIQVKYGFQALALDEQERSNKPVLWNERKQRNHQSHLLQVWFSGDHLDIGGVKEDSRLSDISLIWMIDQCSTHGQLSFDIDGYLRASNPIDINYPVSFAHRANPYYPAIPAAGWETRKGPIRSRRAARILPYSTRHPLDYHPERGPTHESLHASIYHRYLPSVNRADAVAWPCKPLRFSASDNTLVTRKSGKSLPVAKLGNLEIALMGRFSNCLDPDDSTSDYLHTLLGTIKLRTFNHQPKMPHTALGMSDPLAQRTERETLYADGGPKRLRTVLERISNSSDIRLSADLSDFCDLLDGRIDSFLTVTGSYDDAFADSVDSYVRRRWGTRGVNILMWLSEFLSAARLSGPSTSSPLRIDGIDESNNPGTIELHAQLVQRSITPPDKYNVTIRVQCIDGGMKVLLGDVASELAWIVAAFKEPREEGLTFSGAEIEYIFHSSESSRTDQEGCSNFNIVYCEAPRKRFENPTGTCWHQVFTGLNVAIGFPIPHRPNEMRGVEIPFALMTTLAGVGHPVAYEGGFVLKGRENALVPVRSEPISVSIGESTALQWHLVGSEKGEKSRLYMAEVKHDKPSILPIKTDKDPTEFLNDTEGSNRHFLGLYEDVEIFPGADGTRQTIKSARGLAGVKEENQRWPIEWNRTINFSIGGGAGGASAGLGTGFRFRTRKEQELRFSRDRDLDQHLEDASNNFTILYDVQSRVAWMLPQICVVMHLLQEWIKPRYPRARFWFPVLEDMDIGSLRNTFRSFKKQRAAKKAHINLEFHFKHFSNLLDQLQDNEGLKPRETHCHIPKRQKLAGVDFATLAQKPQIYRILTTYIKSETSGDWPKMLRNNWEHLTEHPYKVVTLFCANVHPQPISPKRGSEFCSAWFPVPNDQDYLVTTMYCLRKLASTYGEDPVKLSRQHVWERCTFGPFEACNGQNRNRLQKIVRGNGNRETTMRGVLCDNSVSGAIVFGGNFEVRFYSRCDCSRRQNSASLTAGHNTRMTDIVPNSTRSGAVETYTNREADTTARASASSSNTTAASTASTVSTGYPTGSYTATRASSGTALTTSHEGSDMRRGSKHN
ncbi:hypothetical protein BDV41DRAFT_579685 [Aspergillus transmontanensis]|uniref:T6SS Phospholipase effector Tle1-like catalytic domain-containing protein n=1 Tax=Aspergillus transmontanensis TaxID=1034304 RepID=A0A5N6VP39_9EURO|nr:hypothetical protein BDV41DRAFT_579685 [Aspergillus transmontanensis]